MVSLFGIKVGNRKKKPDKTPEPGAQPKKWKAVDQNAFGEGEYFGRNIHSKGVVNGSIRSTNSRPGTSYSTRSYAHDTHNLAASSMYDLSQAGPVWNTGLRPFASDANLRTKFSNGSSQSLVYPSLASPGPGFSSRPSTANGRAKAKPWVNPLDIHFMRGTATGAPAPAQRSPLGQYVPQSPGLGVRSPLGQYGLQSPTLSVALSTNDDGDGSSIFGDKTDNVVDAVMASVTRKEQEERERREREKELVKHRETERLVKERLERQKSTETKLRPRAATSPLAMQTPSAAPVLPPVLPDVRQNAPPSGPPSQSVFRGRRDPEPASPGAAGSNWPLAQPAFLGGVDDRPASPAPASPGLPRRHDFPGQMLRNNVERRPASPALSNAPPSPRRPPQGRNGVGLRSDRVDPSPNRYPPPSQASSEYGRDSPTLSGSVFRLPPRSRARPDQDAKPVIQNVTAKRDTRNTLMVSAERRQSLSMKIEEFEKSLVAAQNASAIANQSDHRRRSDGSSMYSGARDEEDDEPISPIALSSVSISPPPAPEPLRTSPPSAAGVFQPDRSRPLGPPRPGQGPRRPALEEYAVAARGRLTPDTRRPAPVASGASSSSSSSAAPRRPSPEDSGYSSRSNTPQSRHDTPVQSPEPAAAVPLAKASVTPLASAGFVFDIPPSNSPPTPDSPSWPLAEAVPASAPAPAVRPAAAPLALREEAGTHAMFAPRAPPTSPGIHRSKIPPPLTFDFSPGAASRAQGPWTPQPLRAAPEAEPTPDGRPRTAGSGRPGGLASPRLGGGEALQLPGTEIGVTTEITAARGGPAVWTRRHRLPHRRPDHGLKSPTGIADQFGTNFI